MATAPGAPDVQKLPQMGAPTSLYSGSGMRGSAAPATYESPYKDFQDWSWQTRGRNLEDFGESGAGTWANLRTMQQRGAEDYQKWLGGQRAAFDKANAPAPQQPVQQPQPYQNYASPIGAVPTGMAPAGGGYATPTQQPIQQPASYAPTTGSMPAGAPLPMGGMTPGISTGEGPTINPYSLTAQTAGNQAGAYAGGQGVANLGQAGDIRSGAGQVMQTAFDPQQELYDRTAQQLQDQVRVGQSTRGVAMSPYGAGVEGQTMKDFNIDWQNAQLGRQAMGIGAAGAASMQAGNLGQQGVGQVQAQGQMPWDTWNQQQQTDIQNWISYMNMQNATTGQQIVNYPNVVDAYGHKAGWY